MSQFLFSRILLFDISKDLSNVFLERPVANKYILGRYPSQYINTTIAILVCYKILNISLDPVEGYSPKITNSINYFNCFRSEQVLIEENINIHRYKEGVELVSISIVKV
jgi:hypothetical protein